jgi:hypothetical protein
VTGFYAGDHRYLGENYIRFCFGKVSLILNNEYEFIFFINFILFIYFFLEG